MWRFWLLQKIVGSHHKVRSGVLMGQIITANCSQAGGFSYFGESMEFLPSPIGSNRDKWDLDPICLKSGVGGVFSEWAGLDYLKFWCHSLEKQPLQLPRKRPS